MGKPPGNEFISYVWKLKIIDSNVFEIEGIWMDMVVPGRVTLWAGDLSFA